MVRRWHQSMAVLAGALMVGACGSQRPNAPAAAAQVVPASAAPQTPAGAGKPEALTAAEIDAPIQAQAASLRACYQAQLDVEPNLPEGKLSVQFRITAQGAVQDVQINHARSTFTHPAVAQCVVDIFLHLQFPAKSGGIVNYPLHFSHSTGA